MCALAELVQRQRVITATVFEHGEITRLAEGRAVVAPFKFPCAADLELRRIVDSAAAERGSTDAFGDGEADGEAAGVVATAAGLPAAAATR